MTTATETRPPRRLGRSVLAVVAGLAVNVILAMLMDQMMYALSVFPRPPAITYATGPYIIATAYRAVFGVAGSWLAARLAPSHPMRHALILGAVGLTFCTAGLLAALNMKLGPVWYPLALLAVTLPCAWLGGRLHHPRS